VKKVSSRNPLRSRNIRVSVTNVVSSVETQCSKFGPITGQAEDQHSL